jgi:hypothetical protein
MKFDTKDFYKNLTRHSKSGQSQATVSGILHENLITFILLTTVQNTLLHNNSAKGTHSCISMAKSSDLYCWQLHVGQQECKRNNCCVSIKLAVPQMRRNIGTLPTLSNEMMYSIAQIKQCSSYSINFQIWALYSAYLSFAQRRTISSSVKTTSSICTINSPPKKC